MKLKITKGQKSWMNVDSASQFKTKEIAYLV